MNNRRCAGFGAGLIRTLFVVVVAVSVSMVSSGPSSSFSGSPLQNFSAAQLGQLALFPPPGETRWVVPAQPNRLPFGANHIALFGLKTGDEGKGRTVLEIAELLRFLSDNPAAVAAVIKANGGANSGHTAAGLKLNLIPSGVADPSIPHLCLCRGVVADPLKLGWEIRGLRSLGLDPSPRLRLDRRLMVSHIGHRLLDLASETILPRGSTGRGITPSYADETTQRQIVYEDFLGTRADFADKMRARLREVQARAQGEFRLTPEQWLGLFTTISTAETRAHKGLIEVGVIEPQEVDFTCYAQGTETMPMLIEALINRYWLAGSAMTQYICDVTELTDRLVERGQHVLYEHGQGVLLDKRLGYAPSVTASHTTPAEIFHGNAVPITAPVHAIGVMKAYDTKVGRHRFLTEMPTDHPLSERLRQIEFGTTTGRSRMVGWFDAVEAGWALRRAGAHDMVINKLDVLGYQDAWQGPLRVCFAYQDPQSALHRSLPTSDAARARMTAVYRDVAGWTEDISAVRRFQDLPPNAQIYVATVYRASVEAAWCGEKPTCDLPRLRFIGVGPNPGQIIADVPDPEQLLRLCPSTLC